MNNSFKAFIVALIAIAAFAGSALTNADQSQAAHKKHHKHHVKASQTKVPLPPKPPSGNTPPAPGTGSGEAVPPPFKAGTSARRTTSTVSGTVLSGNTTTRVAGASVWVGTWTTNGWSWTPKPQTYTNSAGNYSVSGLQAGRYYEVYAARQIGSCNSGFMLFNGVGSWFQAPIKTTSTVRVFYSNTLFCG